MCNSCPNCQTRTRWNATYKKYLKDAGDKADVEWVAQMMKTDKKILVCLREMELPDTLESWYESGDMPV